MDIEGNCYSLRIGTHRTLTDGYLRNWLVVYATRDYCIDIKMWTPNDQIKLEAMMAKPSFDHDSVDFCIELIETIDQSIKDGFDPEYCAFPADFYREWDAALDWVQPIKEPDQ
jgi:hypothetical protein